MPIRIWMADDDSNIKMLLRKVLESQPECKVCGEVSNSADGAGSHGRPLFPGLRSAQQFFNSRDQSPRLSLVHHSADSILVGCEIQFR